MKKSYKLLKIKSVKKLLILAIMISIIEFVGFPAPILASELKVSIVKEESPNIRLYILNNVNLDLKIEYPNNSDPVVINTNNNNLPENLEKPNNISVGTRVITAYNSESGQTDDTPCITANGYDVCKHQREDTIAANFLPFGAKVKIPEIFGNKVFIVRDRMNVRHNNRIDIWMIEKTDAIKFGVKLAKIEIMQD